MENKLDNKFELVIENYKSIGNIKITLNKQSSRLITLIGNNNSGKTTILNSIRKLAGNPTINKEDYRTVIDENNLITSKTDKPKILINFLHEKTNEQLEFSWKLENGFSFPHGLSDKQRNHFDDEINKELDLLRKYEKEYLQAGAFVIFPDTFTREGYYYSFKNKILKHGNKSILDLSENVKKLLELKEIKEKEIKEMVTVISIDNTNVFKYTEMKLDLLFRPQEELDESQLGELKVILIWEKILKVNFKNTLKEWSDESNASNKHEMLKNFNERASELLKELTKRFFDSKLDFEFNSFIQYEKSLLHVTLKHTPRFAEGIKEITWNEKISVLGDGAKFLCSIIFRLNSIDSSDPR